MTLNYIRVAACELEHAKEFPLMIKRDPKCVGIEVLYVKFM
jgi:hypothetical protein